jgi:integrase
MNPYRKSDHGIVVQRQALQGVDEAARHRATIENMSEEKKAAFHQYELNSLSAGSVRSYTSDHKVFAGWMAINYPECVDLSQATWPICVDWLRSQVDDGLAQATIQRRWAFLRAHLCLSLKDPTVEREYRKTVKGLFKSVAQEGVKGKKPLMADQVLAALQKIEGRTFDEEQQRMFLLFSFATVLRRSESAAAKWRHVLFSDRGITVNIPHSKSGQKTISVNKKSTPLDVVEPLLAWRERTAAGPDDYLFKAMDSQGRPLDRKVGDKVMSRYVKTAAMSLGLPAAAFGNHSTRSGGLSSHAVAGATTVQLMQLSAHRSLTSLQHYLKGVGDFQHGL